MALYFVRRGAAVRTVATLVLVLTCLPGCALLQKLSHKRPPAPEKTPQAKQLIGTIVMVNVESAFVLIDNGARPSPAKGAAVQGRSADGTSAELKVTDVRKRPFVVGDIVSGTPKVGDEVYQ